MRIFDLSANFPKEEIYSLTDQIRRSSRSVAANIAEAWRKRKYSAAFAAKLNDAEGEAAETETWVKYAVRCEYIDREIAKEIYLEYEEMFAMLVSMRTGPEKRTLSGKK
jgi:four helix bundle protein